MFQQFLQYFQQHKINTKVSRFILAISGGVDSIVLADLCKKADFDFTLAHCNFQLRNEESERDEQFVRSFAAEIATSLEVIRFDTKQFARDNKLSIQEAARLLRYQWFDELQRNGAFDYILLAHHADDNIETALMNYFRGTGLKGLTGIPGGSKDDKHLLRPLLNVRRNEILQHAESEGLKWVEDSSNHSVKYTRNYFRHELIPSISKVFPQVEENLIANIERFTTINKLYQLMVDELIEKISVKGNNEIRFPIKKLEKYFDTSLIYDIIKVFGFGEKQVPEVKKLLTAGSGKFIENENYQVIRHRNWLIIAIKDQDSFIIAIDRDRPIIRYAEGILEFKTLKPKNIQVDTDALTAQLDVKNIEYPLVLRKWKAGDYFYPLGMKKKKKLSRLFIDQKLSKNLKEKTWVIESGNRIIWVVGMRIDDRFKIKPNTKEVLNITLTSL